MKDRPLTDLPENALSRAAPNGSLPTTPTTNGACSDVNASAGQSVNRTKFNSIAALASYSEGDDCSRAAANHASPEPSRASARNRRGPARAAAVQVDGQNAAKCMV